MRVAIVSHYAPPQTAVASHRVLRMSRALLAAGHAVHWVTLDHDLVPRIDATLGSLVPREVRVHGLGGPTLYSQSSASSFFGKVRRSLAYDLPKQLPFFDGHFEWTWRLRRRLPAIVREHAIDAVLLCCSPHGQLALLRPLRRRFPRLALYVDYRDLLSGNPWNEHDKPRVRRQLLMRERRALRHADALFLNTKDAEQRFLEVVGPIDGLAIEVMRNTADYELGAQILGDDPALDLGPGAHLGFFGTLFPQRRLAEIVNAMARLTPTERDRVTLHCYCAEGPSTRLLAEDLATVPKEVAARVTWHPFSDYADAFRAMHAMHALILVNSPDERDVVFVPGKLYDYVMARRPILFVGAAGDASRIVEATSGRAFRYGETEALARAIVECTKDAARATTGIVERYAPAASFAPLLSRLRASSRGDAATPHTRR